MYDELFAERLDQLCHQSETEDCHLALVPRKDCKSPPFSGMNACFFSVEAVEASPLHGGLSSRSSIK